ncbi:TetR/AcrR family transcriptional regulator [Nonomuraea jiangxiensis]|uniref:DNA-binding transcriptional regulator, AcrR family n=1 Tax=Nonomuraea jiangxiensis TaxID=633440 RepID=A0A1G8WGG2_9ACTN|nr:TetR/AcrR family transcriptional regulator [Nonomuraea jiangxiensis]SDJ77233.1 DNA-binding transcriptional regulator, AcrR family [Nonomuraea jiangxiensis]
MAVSARRGTPLTLEEICATAVRMVDDGGVEGLSMRKLAAELDVNPMSLYHHVENKEALLALICATVGDRMTMPPDDGSPWQEQFKALAMAYYRHALAHPALWGYIHNHPELIADRRRPIWQTLNRILLLAGVPEPELKRTSDVLHAFVSGFLFAQVQGHLSDDPGEIARMFDMAVSLITHGLQDGFWKG